MINEMLPNCGYIHYMEREYDSFVRNRELYSKSKYIRQTWLHSASKEVQTTGFGALISSHFLFYLLPSMLWQLNAFWMWN
jgi:hypothetical protein